MRGSHWLCVAGAVVAAVVWLPIEDTYTEVDSVSGTIRSRHVHFGLFGGTWKEEDPSWIKERAGELGIRYTPEWTQISHKSERILSRSWACGHAPPTFFMSPLDVAQASGETDEFLRNYLAAGDKERLEMIRKVSPTLVARAR